MYIIDLVDIHYALYAELHGYRNTCCWSQVLHIQLHYFTRLNGSKSLITGLSVIINNNNNNNDRLTAFDPGQPG